MKQAFAAIRRLLAVVVVASLGSGLTARADQLYLTTLLDSNSNSDLLNYNVTGGSTVNTPPAITNLSSSGVNFAGSVAVDPSGNVYVGTVAGYFNASGSPQIYEFSSTGAYKGVFATLPQAYPGETPIVSSLVWSHGSLYAGDLMSSNVEQFSAAGADKGVAITLPGGDVPAGMTADKAGNIYVAGYNTGNVYENNGATTSLLVNNAAGGDLSAPGGLAIGPNGTLYVSNTGGDKIETFNSSTGHLINANFANFDSFNSNSGGNSPDGLVFTNDGKSLMVALTGYNEFASTGYLLQLPITAGGVLSGINTVSAGLYGPTALALTAATPEPGTLAMAAIGGVGAATICALRRRKLRFMHARPV